MSDGRGSTRTVPGKGSADPDIKVDGGGRHVPLFFETRAKIACLALIEPHLTGGSSRGFSALLIRRRRCATLRRLVPLALPHLLGAGLAAPFLYAVGLLLSAVSRLFCAVCLLLSAVPWFRNLLQGPRVAVDCRTFVYGLPGESSWTRLCC
jgi:hypothetical protein